MLLFEDKIKANKNEFIKELNEISNELEIKPDCLMAVMMMESGLNPAAKNATSGAVGLIQFMPSTYQSYGLSEPELINMKNYEQLKYIKKYYSKFKGKLKNIYSLYLCTFFPAILYTDYKDDTIFQTNAIKAEAVSRSNPALDLNKDGKITVKEFKNSINKRLKNLGLTDKQIKELTENENKENNDKREKMLFILLCLFVVASFLFAGTYLFFYSNLWR